MASTKSVVLLLCFLFAVALLITSEVSARELAEDVQKVEEQGYRGGYGRGGYGGRGGRGGYGGRGGRGGYGGRGRCRGPHCKATETTNEVAAEVDANKHA